MTHLVWYALDLVQSFVIIAALYGVRGFARFAASCVLVGNVAARVGLWFGFFSFLSLIALPAHAAEMCEGDKTYSTWNPSDAAAGFSFSGGNLIATKGGSWSSARATLGKASGKHYFEVTINALCDGCVMVGAMTSAASLSNWMAASSGGWGVHGNTTVLLKHHNGSYSSISGGTLTNGQVVSVAVDLDADKIWWAINGNWFEGDPSTGSGGSYSNLSGTIFPALSISVDMTVTANFGASSFAYSVPSGFNSGWYDLGAEVPCAPDPVDLSAVFAMQALTVAMYCALGGVLGLFFIAGVRAGWRR